MAELTSETLLSASVRDKQNLRDIHELLCRLIARNSNQHRRNHWFKSLSRFRKELGILIKDMDGSLRSAAARAVTERLQFWDQKCIHQWYL